MYRIGIDLGGTNIAVGVVNEHYEIVAEASLPTGAQRPAEQVVADMCRAVELAMENMDASHEKVMEVKRTLAEGILRDIPKTHINGPSIEEASPYVLNVSFNGLRSEVLLHALEEKEIYVSAGSACSSKKKGGSHVLRSLGLSEERIEGAIRFSFCRYNTVDEAAACLEILKEKTAFLRKYMR